MITLHSIAPKPRGNIAARAGYYATVFGQRAFGPNLKRITHTELLLGGPWDDASIASSSIVDGGVRIRHGVRLNPAQPT